MKVLLMLFTASLLSCTDRPRQAKQAQEGTLIRHDTIPHNDIPEKGLHTDTATFLSYNDDGDYALLIARNENGVSSFVNENEDNRQLLRGDTIEISWKQDRVDIAGDQGASEQKRIIGIRKLKDGSVSLFRKSYDRQLKYNWAPENNYSKNYLDQLYLLVEYYLANTNNVLLRSSISGKEEITYSIEQQQRGDREYTVLGIGTESGHRQQTAQWLYYDNNNDKLYEYDLPKDTLITFEK